ncbi:mitochondrial transcription rescue factor 1 [Dromiciops gliroides]|uniref:mitochondrial transcription rescue factor 1 n=1 Tax=Dromiciops gliroides TaxID=33562 RepID=UPI001CC3AA42|nr:mitochondrial transcription rescue factor 1 [Dromiciops gliroides]XP_043820539.1 mitochondrial transcription rescue factor 1 [Dromiciops gliroides]XP_043820540.1 mitochondrial transcription rescue factor 1 [Dromiciops gliroides]XP_043820541.1 mitochondrial transcription rescue factor 1 [Dromiciops gliroides]XP_043820542.1 mitochondrial transcription rescue factor 1 [Dromiciops gliroides]
MYAMTSLRLPIRALRKPNAWIGLWGTSLVHKPCNSGNQYINSSSYQLNYRTLFYSISSVKLPGLLISPECISLFSIRLKSNTGSKESSKKALQKADDDDDDSDEDRGEMSEQEDEVEDDPNVVKDYKDVEKVVPSFRYDVILKTGLDLARNKIEDAFYKGDLRLNGEKLWKKSRTVKVGDTLDLIIGEDKESETEIAMRIVLKKVSEEKTESEKYRILLRRWKKIRLPKKSVSK